MKDQCYSVPMHYVNSVPMHYVNYNTAVLQFLLSLFLYPYLSLDVSLKNVVSLIACFKIGLVDLDSVDITEFVNKHAWYNGSGIGVMWFGFCLI